MKKLAISFEEKYNHEKMKAELKSRNTANRGDERQRDIVLIKKLFPTAKKIICIGARDDSEVKSFSKAKFNVIGIDFVVESTYVKKYDAHELDKHFEENQFDIAYCSHSLEHMLDGEKVLSNIRKIASQGVFITLPCDGGFSKSHSFIFDVMEEAGRNNLPKDLSEFNDRMELLNDFKNLEPYELIFLGQYGWRGDEPKNKEDKNDFVKKPKQKFTEFSMIFKWGEN